MAGGVYWKTPVVERVAVPNAFAAGGLSWNEFKSGKELRSVADSCLLTVAAPAFMLKDQGSGTGATLSQSNGQLVISSPFDGSHTALLLHVPIGVGGITIGGITTASAVEGRCTVGEEVALRIPTMASVVPRSTTAATARELSGAESQRVRRAMRW